MHNNATDPLCMHGRSLSHARKSFDSSQKRRKRGKSGEWERELIKDIMPEMIMHGYPCLTCV